MPSGKVRNKSSSRRTRAGSSLRRLAVIGAGLALQTAGGGCEQTLANIADALGNPVAAGVNAGVSNLVQALVLSLLV